MRTIALEGLNGCGKTHLINRLSREYSTAGLTVQTHKVAGFGDSPRLRGLRRIMGKREQLRLKEALNGKELQDYLSDRIVRLAIRIQIREYLNKILVEKPNLVFLDRTPMMSWVYSSSISEDNPYLDEILAETLNSTKKLSIDDLFVIDIPPAICYARIFSRVPDEPGSGLPTLEQLAEQCLIPTDCQKQIQQEVQKIRNNSQGQMLKPFAPWDLMKYRDVVAQRENYLALQDVLPREIGVNVRVIDGSAEVSSVASQIRQHLKIDII